MKQQDSVTGDLWLYLGESTNVNYKPKHTRSLPPTACRHLSGQARSEQGRAYPAVVRHPPWAGDRGQGQMPGGCFSWSHRWIKPSESLWVVKWRLKKKKRLEFRLVVWNGQVGSSDLTNKNYRMNNFLAPNIPCNISPCNIWDILLFNFQVWNPVLNVYPVVYLATLIGKEEKERIGGD